MIIVLATCAEFLTGEHALAHDDRLLLAEIQARGHQARAADWNDPTVDWAGADLVIIRSTWDYIHHAEAFQLWLWYIQQVSRLVNPYPIVRWNLDKHYLHEIAEQGIAIVPTCWLYQGRAVDLSRLLEEYGWEHAVLKPCVGNNSWHCLPFDRRDPSQLQTAQEHLQQIFREGDAMLQPYLSTIATAPEQSHVFFDGQWSHTFERTPFPSHQPLQTPPGTLLSPEAVSPIAIQQAKMIVNHIEDRFKTTLPVARIDLVQDEQGCFRLMEAELIEPILHLEAPKASERLANLLVGQAMQLHR